MLERASLPIMEWNFPLLPCLHKAGKRDKIFLYFRKDINEFEVSYAMNNIRLLAQKFRKAMDKANSAGCFSDLIAFRYFPRGACGDTCLLLAEYLLEHGIYTAYVCGQKYPNGCGEKNPQSHAWLLVVNKSDSEYNENRKNAISHYHESVLHGETIIDITGDQFSDDADFLNYDEPVYVGKEDAFHKLFEIDEVHKCGGLEEVIFSNQDCMHHLYNIIKRLIV